MTPEGGSRFKDEYGTIVVPDPWGRHEQDKSIEVTPITDAWLVAKERTWEEVDQVLEGRIFDLQKGFQNPRTSPIKSASENYGLDHGVDITTARTLAYVDLLDEYRWQREGHSRSAEVLRSAFDAEKETIKRTSRNHGVAQKRIREVGIAKYNEPIARLTARAQEKMTVEKLILRKAVMEIFFRDVDPTQSPSISSLPKIIEDGKSFLESSNSQSNLQERNPFDYFIDSLTTYLSQTQDAELFRRYRYKNTSGLVSTPEDAHVLQTAIRFALEPSSTDASGESYIQLSQLGKAYFGFLKNRAWSIAVGDKNRYEDITTEKYPLLSLLYDTYSVALYRGNPATLQNISALIDHNFTSRINSKTGEREIRECMKSWEEIATPAFQLLEYNLQLFPEMPDDALYFNEKIPEAVALLTSDEYRLRIGIETLQTIMDRSSDSGISKSAAIKSAYQQLKRIPVLRTFPQKTVLSIISALLQISHPPLYRSNGIYVDSILFSQRSTIYLSDVAEVGSYKEDLEALKKLHEEFKVLNRSSYEAHVMNHFIFGFLTENGEIPNNLEQENSYLWNEVLNNLRWFVSPRGDRYKSSRDAELAKAHIDAVTFRIDRQHPREHIVDVKIDSIDQPWRFWLDTNRNLLNEERQPVLADYRYREVLINFLLKRLYVITSGKLAKEQDTTYTEEGVEGYPLGYKRAHYVYLNSTTTRPITMTSHGAIVHAHEILREYGIDIFGEIRRRRNIGTLLPNQYLTFRREHAEFLEGQPTPIPNELTYDPSLVQIPNA